MQQQNANTKTQNKFWSNAKHLFDEKWIWIVEFINIMNIDFTVFSSRPIGRQEISFLSRYIYRFKYFVHYHYSLHFKTHFNWAESLLMTHTLR